MCLWCLVISKSCVNSTYIHIILRCWSQWFFLLIARVRTSLTQTHPLDIHWIIYPELFSHHYVQEIARALQILKTRACIHLQCVMESLRYPRCRYDYIWYDIFIFSTFNTLQLWMFVIFIGNWSCNLRQHKQSYECQLTPLDCLRQGGGIILPDKFCKHFPYINAIVINHSSQSHWKRLIMIGCHKRTKTLKLSGPSCWKYRGWWT